ncbi:MAG TPA: hypothetical protein VF092_24665 [Longimicrobium sp.]
MSIVDLVTHRRARLALAAGMLPLAAGASSGFRAEPPPSPAAGYVYYGAVEGGRWTARNFDNLTRRSGGNSADPADAIHEGDLLRARVPVNVRARPWTVQAEEPPVTGALRPGERVVVRDIQPVGLSEEFRRMGFWIRYEHPPRRR